MHTSEMTQILKPHQTNQYVWIYHNPHFYNKLKVSMHSSILWQKSSKVVDSPTLVVTRSQVTRTLIFRWGHIQRFYAIENVSYFSSPRLFEINIVIYGRRQPAFTLPRLLLFIWQNNANCTPQDSWRFLLEGWKYLLFLTVW